MTDANNEAAAPAAPEAAAAAPATSKAAKAAAAAKPETGADRLAAILKRKPESIVRLIAPKGRLGNAFAPEVVYGETVGTKRRVADIKENVWEQKQIVAGILQLESDDEG